MQFSSAYNCTGVLELEGNSFAILLLCHKFLGLHTSVVEVCVRLEYGCVTRWLDNSRQCSGLIYSFKMAILYRHFDPWSEMTRLYQHIQSPSDAAPHSRRMDTSYHKVIRSSVVTDFYICSVCVSFNICPCLPFVSNRNTSSLLFYSDDIIYNH